MEQMIRSVYSLNSLTPLILLTHSASLCFSSGSWLWLLYGHICRLWLQLHVWRRCHLQWVKFPTHGHCCKRGSNIRNSSHASGISLITWRTSLCGPVRHELEYEEFDSRHLWAVWAVTLLCINVGAVSQTSSWCSLSDQAQQSLYVHVTCSVSSQRWCCETNAVTVCARYLLCFLTTLVLWDKCSHCVCTLFTLFAHNVGAVRQMQSLRVHVIYSVSSQRWCCWMKLSLYVHVFCSKLVLSDKPVSVCAR